MFSATILEHFHNPHRRCSSETAEVIGRAGVPGEGPHLLLFLRAEDNQITEAGFDTYGCPTATACGSLVSSWVEGKTFEQASILEPGDIGLVLGGLPLGKEHCAVLAVTALRDALRQWHDHQRGEGQ